MDEELNRINELFIINKNKLPLVLHNVEAKKKHIGVSGKIVTIAKYRTDSYPIDGYYKFVTRILL